LVDDVQTVWKSAGELYASSCASCHALPKPNSFSANQWPAIMEEQAVNANLDPGNTALLTTYLQVKSGR
jgi:nitrate/TMAO reductase-like tetraheme cytochrome c subunit